VPEPLTVGYGSRPAYDVYSVDAAQRTSPPADHVVVAGIPAVPENLSRYRIESGHVAADLTVGRQTEERVANVGWPDRGSFAYFVNPLLQYPANEVYAIGEVVAGRDLRLCGDAPVFIQKTKCSLRTSTVDAEIHPQPIFGRGWMETPFTTRFTFWSGNGLSGV
jgi:hypothetical protein